MSSLTSAAFNISEELRRQLEPNYRGVLIKIKRGLTEDDEKDFRFYYTDCVVASDTLSTWKFFRSLEDAREISWEDVSFLKEGLRAVQRKDLEKILTEFENRRNLTALVYMYAGKRQGFEESSFCLNLVEQEAGYLTRTTAHEMSAERTFYKSLLESTKSIKKVLGEFDEVSRHKRLDPWSQLTRLVVIVGENVAEAFRMREERRLTSEEIGKIRRNLRSAADELYCRMRKLGTWEDFCEHIEDNYKPNCPQQNSVSLSTKEIADVVHQRKNDDYLHGVRRFCTEFLHIILEYTPRV